MNGRPTRWVVGKSLEGLGMIVVLVGLGFGVEMGFKEEGLKSMSYELGALCAGGALFVIGYLLERDLRQ